MESSQQFHFVLILENAENLSIDDVEEAREKSKTQETSIELCYEHVYYLLGLTVNRFLPFNRRRCITFLPALERIFLRNPCTRNRLRLFG